MHLDISGANFKPYPLAVAGFSVSGNDATQSAATIVAKVLDNDLAVSGLFQLLDRKSFLANSKREGFTAATIDFSKWTAVGADGLVKALVSGDASGKLKVEIRLFNVTLGNEDLRKEYTAPNRELARVVAHSIADDLLKHFTGESGPFRTRLAFVRATANSGKEIVVADYDGDGADRVATGGLNLLPTWNANGRALAFTSYRGGAPGLFRVDVASRAVQSLVARGDLATGPAFSPDGTRLAFTLSEQGDTHVYVANADGSNVKRLTEGFGIDVSPTWSPDGKRIAFVSSRAGSPQIYVMLADGSGQTRLTFQGNYNQEPSWSPRGDVIAFTARDERHVFDLFTVRVDNGKIVRLTQDQGNNVHLSFAPNGRLAAFASNRPGHWSVYVMNAADGSNQRMLISEATDVTSPAWGPWTK